MKRFKINFLFSAILLMTFNLSFAQNLISNGDFESGITGWNKGTAGMSTIGITSTVVNTGNNACSINITGKPTNFWDINLSKGAIAFTLGQSYTLSFYAKSNVSGAIVNVVIQNTKYQAKKFVLNTSWTKYTWIVQAAEVAPNFSLQLGFAENIGATLYVDDIQLTPPTSSPSQAFSDSINVNIANKHQVIEGLGGAIAYQETSLFQNYDVNKPNLVAMDSLFTGLRISWIRLFNLWTDSTAWYKDNFKFDAAIIGHAQKRLGFTPKIQITSWSAPAYLKQNNVVNGTNTTNPGVPTLKKNSDGTYKYNEFGQWWLRSVKKYQSFGINPDYISIQNELDYDVPYECTRFDPVENATFAGYGPALNAVYNAMQTLTNKPKIIGPETYGIGGNQVQRYLKPLTNAWQLSGYAYHLYSGNMGDPDGFLPDLSTLSTLLADKPSYQTEFYNESSSTSTKTALQQAWIIHNTFVVGKASAYIHWDPIWGNASTAFINGDGTNVRQHYYGFKQFSRFIQPGWRMVDGTSNSSYLRSSAYANTNGDSLTVIVLNIGTQTGSIKINLGNFITNGGTVYQTNESNLKCTKTGVYLKGGTLSIPGETVATITFVKDIPPVVAITSPSNNASFLSPGSIPITVKATDADGTIKNVRIMDGNVQIALLTGPNFNYTWNTSAIGVHKLTAIATDNAGATTTSAPVSVTIKSTCPLSSGTITASGATTFCQGNSVTLSGINGTSYVWRNGTTQVATTPTFSATSTGSYTVIVINASGCKDTSLAKVITVNALPNATISSTTNSFCTASNVTLTATSGTSYKWFKGTSQVGTSQTYNANTAGDYTVQVTNSNACSATSVVRTIIENPLPVLTHNTRTDTRTWSQSITFTACEGENIFTGPWPNVSTGWIWTGPNGFSANTRNPSITTISSAKAGKYTATYTDANGCSNSLDLNVIVSVPVATITSTSNSFCTGKDITLTANSGASYKWFKGTTQVGTSQTYKANTPDDYTVQVTNSNACTSTSAVKTIAENALPVLTHNTKTDTKSWSQSTDFSVCVGENVYTGPWPNRTTDGWNWTGPNGFTSTLRSPVLSNVGTNQSGKYTASYTDGNGCSASLDLNLLINAPEAITFNYQVNGGAWKKGVQEILCEGDNIQFAAWPVSGSTWSWTGPNGFTSTLRNPLLSNFGTTKAGIYTATQKDANSCTSTANFTLTKCVVTAIDFINENSESVIVYPNPSKGSFKISNNFENEIQISIYDMRGQVVYVNSILSNQEISPELSSGVYILKTVGTKSQQFKIIIQ